MLVHLYQIYKQGQEHGGEQTGHHQGQAADGSRQGTDFVGFGGADDVPAGTEGHTLGDRISDAEDAAEGRTHDVGENAGKDNGGGGDAGHAARHFTEGNADGGGDGFGHQGNGQLLLEAEDHAAKQHHCKAGNGTGCHTGGNGGQIFLQQLELLIHGNCQTDGGRRQQPGQGAHAGLIRLHGAAGGGQEQKHQHHGGEDGIQQGRLQLLLEFLTQKESDKGQRQGQNTNGKQLSHACGLPSS